MQAANERRKYRKHQEKARSDPRYMTLIIDGMTQKTTALPHWVRKPSWVDQLEYGTHVIGSITEGLGIHLEFSYTDNIGDGSNVLIDNINKAVDRMHCHRRSKGEQLPEVLYLQLDNTTHNKSQVLFTYLSWLVEIGVFKKIKVNYLMVGHTHEIIDQVFSRYSIKLRKVTCLTLPELMEVAKTCYEPNPTVEHVQSVTDWLQWFLDQSAMNTSTCDMTFNHAFRIKKCNVIRPEDPNSTEQQVRIHSKLIGWRPDSNSLKAWKPNGGTRFLMRLPEGQPEACPIRSFELRDIESLRRIVHGFEVNFGDKFRGDLKAYWDRQFTFQESVFDGNCDATDYDFLRLLPPSTDNPAPPPRTQEQLIADLPPQLQRTINLPERPVATTSGRSLRRQAQLYAQTEHFEVPFSNMKIGSYALVLCPDSTEIPFGFKLKVGQQKYSPWLYLVKCTDIDRPNKTSTWVYLQPMSFTGHARDRQIAIQKAGLGRTWMEDPRSTQTAEYCQDEVILSWDLERGSSFEGIPTEQFNQCKLVLAAMDERHNVEDD